MEINKIYNESNLDTMSKMPDNFVDLVITSPPYDNLRAYTGESEWNFELFQKIAKELYRVIKEGGVMVWIVSDATIKGSETCTSFKQALYFRECGFNLHDTMIWAKDGGGAIGSNNCYTQNFEYMFVFSKGTPSHINLIRDKRNLSYGKERRGNCGRRNEKGEWKEANSVVRMDNEFSKRNNWWVVIPSKQEGSIFHPAVFPENIVSDHIKSWSNEGDLVYDPFSGSGTTAKMAYLLNRKYIGSEISEEYFNMSLKRLHIYTSQLKLF